MISRYSDLLVIKTTPNPDYMTTWIKRNASITSHLDSIIIDSKIFRFCAFASGRKQTIISVVDYFVRFRAAISRYAFKQIIGTFVAPSGPDISWSFYGRS
jgi:uncharacterized PurR-regulated membrane protein YhhQ (DUF165 family)